MVVTPSLNTHDIAEYNCRLVFGRLQFRTSFASPGIRDFWWAYQSVWITTWNRL